MVNGNKPSLWKTDTIASVDMYNAWFMKEAPTAFRESRIQATRKVEEAFIHTDYLRDITVESLRKYPSMLPVLRMSTCPPLAVDRLIGLAKVPKSVVDVMEKQLKISRGTSDKQLEELIKIVDKLLDRDIFPWLLPPNQLTEVDAHRGATIVADRYCGALTNPIIRNAQEQRQLALIEKWLLERGYKKTDSGAGVTTSSMASGTFMFRMNVPVKQGENSVNIPVDVVVKSMTANEGDLPILIEAKSAGDFTNVNKRRKEEAQKFTMLKETYGDEVHFILFLCGYFDAAYLGYSAAEGIDWVWEHRIDDLSKIGL